MNNLGNALSNQGTRTAGEAGAALLARAVEAYEAALEVRTREGHAVDWATATENLAILEEAIADHDSTAGPLPHRQAALARVKAALEVLEPAHMPTNHQKATTLRDRLRARLSAPGGPTPDG